MNRLKHIFILLLTTLAMVACSKDDNNGMHSPGKDNGESQLYYMSVNLGMDGNGGGTRLTYDDGVEAESAVKKANARFYFYDEFGTPLAVGEFVDKEGFLELNASNKPGVSHESEKLIILGPSERYPTYVLAVLNSTQNFEGKRMEEVYEAICSSAISSTKGAFVMTNASYLDTKNKFACALDIKGKLFTTAEDALADPVNIYVERIVAKVSMKYADKVTGTFPVDDEYLSTDGTGVNSIQMRVVVDGWCLNALNTKTTYVKSLDEKWATNLPFTGWNDSFRSYWALDHNHTSNIGTSSEAFYTESETYKELTYRSWNEAKNGADTKTEYCYENTVDKAYQMAKPDNRTNVTTMLVAAHAEYSTDKGTSWVKDADLYSYNGTLYTTEGYKNLYLQWLQEQGYGFYKSITDANGSSIEWKDFTAENITFTTESVGESFKRVRLKVTDIGVPSGYTLTQKATDGTISSTEVTTQLIDAAVATMNAANRTECFAGGKCYYQIPIKHLANEGETNYGVVRNHIYQLVLSGISRIGEPVYNPDKGLEYIPGEKDNYWIAARISILKWRIVNQETDFM